jgi:putative PIN family toxin of toxin-antitoxin system
MVFLQAAVSRRGPAFILLTLAEFGRLELLLSAAILTELREVLLRPAVQKKFPLLTTELVEAFLAHLMRIGILVADVPREFRLDRDPDDEAYVNLALAGRAQYLVTRDSDLLDLADQRSLLGAELRRLRPELQVLDPAALLELLATDRRSP